MSSFVENKVLKHIPVSMTNKQSFLWHKSPSPSIGWHAPTKYVKVSLKYLKVAINSQNLNVFCYSYQLKFQHE